MKIAMIMVLWAVDGRYDWVKYSIPLFRKFFPSETLVLVDNNNNPQELDFVKQYTPIVLPGRRANSHGQGIDIAVQWCRENDIDIMVHIEPDCSFASRLWFDSLVRPIESGVAWMTGGVKMRQGYTHICPTAWLIPKINHSFCEVPRGNDIYLPEFRIMINVRDMIREIDVSKHHSDDIWYYLYWWDTGVKNWFEIALKGRALLVPIPGITHHWLGSRRSPKSLWLLL
jgi:hypothetical protein